MRSVRLLGAVALGASAFLAGGANAACYGTANTATACYANRPVYSDCVYTGTGPCQPVTVNGPTCIYGTIGQNGQYQTVWC